MRGIIKVFVVTLLTIWAAQSFAGVKEAYDYYVSTKITGTDKMEKVMYELLDGNYYFAASVLAQKRLEEDKPIDRRFSHALEEISLKVGVDFIYKSQVAKSHYGDSTVRFALGLNDFKNQNYQRSFNHLKDLKEDDRYYPEAMMITGTIASLYKKADRAKKHYNACITSAVKHSKASKRKEQKAYYDLMAEDCLINQGRDLYAQGKYKEALTVYQSVPKNSYRWPYILLEKAWVYYKLGDYNRSLGTLVTYKAPLLESYFFPEAEVLMALNYFKLCLWNDADIVIKRFYKDYRVHAVTLKKMLASNMKRPNYFYNLSQRKNYQGLDRYTRNQLMALKKQVKYSLDIVPIKRAENELKQFRKLKKGVFANYITQSINASKVAKIDDLNSFIGHGMVDFLNQTHRFSKELFIMELEVLSKQRTLLYNKEKLISNRGRGDLSNVKISRDEEFYNFNGAFWADELGEYSFGLKSNCKRVGE